ncbi:MAG: hypothetical protein CL816_04125 [Coxiellaceae bacterium]|nr:hypothetical protein [Coxiellaceae bacterium]|tara:strand:- start:280 stop:537 length:258 start_codon:yes stop_codon:yes gene_type:complete
MVWDFKLRFTLFSVFMSFLARWMTMFNDEHDGERGLRCALGRRETKDNVLDFPLAFSLRREFSVENVLARCLEKLTGFKKSIQLA